MAAKFDGAAHRNREEVRPIPRNSMLCPPHRLSSFRSVAPYCSRNAGVVELVDTLDLGSSAFGVQVRVLFPVSRLPLPREPRVTDLSKWSVRRNHSPTEWKPRSPGPRELLLAGSGQTQKGEPENRRVRNEECSESRSEPSTPRLNLSALP